MKKVLCPECSSCHNHIKSVQVFYGNDNPQSNSDLLALRNGTFQYFNSPRPKDYRLFGMSVLIKYACECGLEWSEETYTHKGSCCREKKS
jgi:hypothetical protein